MSDVTEVKELATVDKLRALSRLELRVLACYLSGQSYKEMAHTCRVKAKTCDNALQRVKRKLRPSNNA